MISNFWRLLLITVTILGLDSLWLYLNKDLYLNTFARIQKSPVTINIVGAIMAYSALILGAYLTTGVGSSIQIPFINTLLPGLSGKVFNGRLFATMLLFAVAYLVWNGTALAVFRDYSSSLAFVDSMWGIVLGAIVGYLGQL